MRTRHLQSRIAGLALIALSLLWLLPIHHAAARPTPLQPASPARLEQFAPTAAGAPAWTEIDPADVTAPRALVLLVHGLDEPGSIWDALAPELAAAHLTPVRFEYPNDQPIARSAEQLHETLADLRAAGATDLFIVAHSMGGLVALDTLTRESLDPADRPEVRRLITLGTPMAGSLLAPVRFIAEWREHAIRAAQDGSLDQSDLDRAADDGAGEAGTDLTPESDFLTDLSTRSRPAHLPITAVVAEIPKVDAAGLQNTLLSALPAPLQSDPDARASARALGAWTARWLTEASDLIGDGVVDADSARGAWTTDVVPVRALHRSMITHVPCPIRGSAEPPAIAVVLDRIGRDLESSR